MKTRTLFLIYLLIMPILFLSFLPFYQKVYVEAYTSTFVSSTNGNVVGASGTQTLTKTLPNVKTTNFIVVAVGSGYNTGITWTVTDNATGGTNVYRIVVLQTSVRDNAIFVAIPKQNETLAITVQSSNGGFLAFFYQFTGFPNIRWSASASTNQGFAVTSISYTSPPITAVAGDMVILNTIFQNNADYTFTSYTAPSGYTKSTITSSTVSSVYSGVFMYNTSSIVRNGDLLPLHWSTASSENLNHTSTNALVLRVTQYPEITIPSTATVSVGAGCPVTTITSSTSFSYTTTQTETFLDTIGTTHTTTATVINVVQTTSFFTTTSTNIYLSTATTSQTVTTTQTGIIAPDTNSFLYWFFEIVCLLVPVGFLTGRMVRKDGMQVVESAAFIQTVALGLMIGSWIGLVLNLATWGLAVAFTILFGIIVWRNRN